MQRITIYVPFYCIFIHRSIIRRWTGILTRCQGVRRRSPLRLRIYCRPHFFPHSCFRKWEKILTSIALSQFRPEKVSSRALFRTLQVRVYNRLLQILNRLRTELWAIMAHHPALTASSRLTFIPNNSRSLCARSFRMLFTAHIAIPVAAW